MELSWIGRYRELTSALVSHSNYSNRTISLRRNEGNGIKLSQREFQVLEVLLEHEDEMLIMADISSQLGILPGLLSTITKHLLSYGLVERYQLEGNRKNTILKPTEKGRSLYLDYCEHIASKIFANYFARLESFTDEQLSAFADAIKALNVEIALDQEKDLQEQAQEKKQKQKQKLIKI